MKSFIRWTLRSAAVLVVLGALLWVNRTAVALWGVGVLMDLRMPVGPHREIDWATGVDPEQRPTGKRPPNIVLILADDLGWNDLTFNGGGVAGGSVPTANIDSIASQGVTFTNGYAANGTCAPSRAALLSGRYPTRFGFEFTPTPPAMPRIIGMLNADDPLRTRKPILAENEQAIGDFDELGMPASEITLAELLKDVGYHTVHIGKWHLGGTGGMAAEDQGFDESLLMANGLHLPVDDPNVVNSKQDFDPIDRFLWRAMKYAASFNGGEAFEPGGYLTDYYTEEAVKVIEANRDRPFFLYLAYFAPHTPLQATKADYDALSHIKSHRQRVYAAMIRALDRGVGRVLEALRDNGLENDTLVVFTSDNGGAHYIGIPDVNKPFRGWKITYFEGGIHVPFFAKWPARIPGGSRYDAPVQHFDVMPTAVAAAGATLPTDRPIDGRDLLPFVRGESAGVPHRKLFWRSGASQSALIDGWKLNLSNPPGRAWLFDLRTDPNEKNDLAAAEPAKVAEMRAEIEAHNATQVPPSWPSVAAMPINLDKDITVPDAPDDEYIYWSN